MLKNLNPYFLLGITPDASDEEIAEAYETSLKAIRREKDAEAEESLRIAFEKIRTEADRIQFDLFDVSSAERTPLETFLGCANWMRRQDRLNRLGMEDLRALFGSLVGPQPRFPDADHETHGASHRQSRPKHPVKDVSSERLNGKPGFSRRNNRQRPDARRNRRARR